MLSSLLCLILITVLPTAFLGTSAAFIDAHFPAKDKEARASLNPDPHKEDSGLQGSPVPARSLIKIRADEEQPDRPKTPDSPSLPGLSYEPISRPQLPDRLSTPQTPIGDRNTNPSALGLQAWMQHERPKQVVAKKQHIKASKVVLDAYRERESVIKRVGWPQITLNDYEKWDAKRNAKQDAHSKTIAQAQGQGYKANRAFQQSQKNIMNVAMTSQSLLKSMENYAPQRPNDAWPVGHPFRDPRREGFRLFGQNEALKKGDEQRIKKLEDAYRKEYKLASERDESFTAPPTNWDKVKAIRQELRPLHVEPQKALQNRYQVARMWAGIPSARDAVKNPKIKDLDPLGREYVADYYAKKLWYPPLKPSSGGKSSSNSGISTRSQTPPTSSFPSRPGPISISKTPFGTGVMRPTGTLSATKTKIEKHSPSQAKTLKEAKSSAQAESAKESRSATPKSPQSIPKSSQPPAAAAVKKEAKRPAKKKSKKRRRR